MQRALAETRTRLDPVPLGLGKRVHLERAGSTIFLIKERKTRIIMKDGKQLHGQLALALAALKPDGVTKGVLETTAPVCGKTTSYLTEAGIEIRQVWGGVDLFWGLRRTRFLLCVACFFSVSFFWEKNKKKRISM